MRFAILAIGNVLQKDDGMGVLAARYLKKNYTFEPTIEIIEGGVEGMQLLNSIMEYDEILFLDAIDVEGEAGSIYHIPTSELKSSALVQSSAHEIGLLESLSMLELMEETVPPSTLLAIVPEKIETGIGLSESLKKRFDIYITQILKLLQDKGYSTKVASETLSFEDVVESFSTALSPR
jgi:hydrogenase maturation protease